MPIPVLVLLLFALWTLLTLVVSVGKYRMAEILSGRSPFEQYRFPDVDRSETHRQALRAHLNCLENLAVYGALVLVMVYTGNFAPILSVLAIVLLGFRILHTFVHVALPQRGKILILRFSLFLVQLVCLFWIALYLLVT
ncbi:MAG: MAPEG family protein [Myxococcales bacterium]